MTRKAHAICIQQAAAAARKASTMPPTYSLYQLHERGPCHAHLLPAKVGFFARWNLVVSEGGGLLSRSKAGGKVKCKYHVHFIYICPPGDRQKTWEFKQKMWRISPTKTTGIVQNYPLISWLDPQKEHLLRSWGRLLVLFSGASCERRIRLASEGILAALGFCRRCCALCIRESHAEVQQYQKPQ